MDFWLETGTADASPEAKAKNAVLIVRALGCHDPATAEVSGVAVQMVDGRRQTTPAQLVPMKEPGTFAVTRVARRCDCHAGVYRTQFRSLDQYAGASSRRRDRKGPSVTPCVTDFSLVSASFNAHARQSTGDDRRASGPAGGRRGPRSVRRTLFPLRACGPCHPAGACAVRRSRGLGARRLSDRHVPPFSTSRQYFVCILDLHHRTQPGARLSSRTTGRR